MDCFRIPPIAPSINNHPFRFVCRSEKVDSGNLVNERWEKNGNLNRTTRGYFISLLSIVQHAAEQKTVINYNFVFYLHASIFDRRTPSSAGGGKTSLGEMRNSNKGVELFHSIIFPIHLI